MAETALNFGPEWLRALSHGNSAPLPVAETPLPKYKLAQYRYGREEMLALFSKDLLIPDALKEFDYLITEKCQLPLALLPITEEEQRIWARSVNSDVALRASVKGPSGSGNGMLRGGRGGSVDRGRGRGRGGYYQRGVAFDENDDGPPAGFPRLRTLERSQSVSEKDQRWEERDRRLERHFAGRSGILDDSGSLTKPESLRPSTDSWRRNEKDDDGGWRTSSTRGTDKFGGRTLWRTANDRDRVRSDAESRDRSHQGRDLTLNGPGKNISHHPKQRSTSGHFWDEDATGDNLPEWSVEDSAITDVVGTFDSSGAFMETKMSKTSFNSDDIYTSDDEDCVKKKESPKMKPEAKPKVKTEKVVANEVPSVKQPIEPKGSRTSIKEETIEKSPVQSSPEVLYIEKNSGPQEVTNNVPRTTNVNIRSEICTAKNVHPKTVVPEHVAQTEDLPGPTEEDTFAHHKKATENMMAQWTEEDEQKVASEAVVKTVIPVHHEDAQKWFYRDPQAEIQGPFTSAEMCDWFKAGYFTMDLLVRRGCDERFIPLGELIQSWGRVPFSPGANPPPLQIAPVQTVPITTPITQTAAPIPTSSQPAAQLSQTDAQLQLMQQQMLQQLMQQQQILLRQAHLQQVLVQLKQQESFAKLSPQQQTQAVQQLLAQQQQQQQPQIPRPNVAPLTEQSILEAVQPVPFPLMGLPVPALMKNDLSLWNVPPTTGAWTIGQSPTQPPGGSIWDTDTPVEVSELEKQQKLAAEEEEKRRQAIEAVKKLEEEKLRREEEERKQKEAEELLREIHRQQEEEKRRLEELQRLKEEEQRRQEEIRRLEEKQKEEERRLEELRKQEELRKLEEERKQAELEEQKQKEHQRKEELKRAEELRKQEEKRQEELQKKQKEQEMKATEKQEARKLKEQTLESKKQKEAERQKEVPRREVEKQRELTQKKETEKQELHHKKETENNQYLVETKGPVWGVVSNDQPSGELSLSDIQKLQEKKELEEKRMKLQHLQQHQLLVQQQSLKQAQANKNGLSWAKRSADCTGAVKSLAEIQQEETQKLVQLQQKPQKTTTTTQVNAASGVWGNSSQISRVSAPPVWNTSNSCFWDDVLKSATAQKPTYNSDSAFPALSNSAKPASLNSNKSKNVRAKKDEDTVLKIFETQRDPTDEFAAWCVDALSNLPSSVDVPTFATFLMEIDSPYEVYDYVHSYLGESKEASEFGKQFLERRSKYRNQVKQASTEENMWGPAPAITPSIKPVTVGDCDATTCTKGKAKKKKNKMHKLDSSMLGFTVQPNPDRINVGEIDRVEGM